MTEVWSLKIRKVSPKTQSSCHSVLEHPNIIDVKRKNLSPIHLLRDDLRLNIYNSTIHLCSQNSFSQWKNKGKPYALRRVTGKKNIWRTTFQSIPVHLYVFSKYIYIYIYIYIKITSLDNPLIFLIFTFFFPLVKLVCKSLKVL